MRHELPFRPGPAGAHPEARRETRGLGLPTWSDKLVGEVVWPLFEAYDEPTVSDRAPTDAGPPKAATSRVGTRSGACEWLSRRAFIRPLQVSTVVLLEATVCAQPDAWRLS